MQLTVHPTILHRGELLLLCYTVVYKAGMGSKGTRQQLRHLRH